MAFFALDILVFIATPHVFPVGVDLGLARVLCAARPQGEMLFRPFGNPLNCGANETVRIQSDERAFVRFFWAVLAVRLTIRITRIAL